MKTIAAAAALGLALLGGGTAYAATAGPPATAVPAAVSVVSAELSEQAARDLAFSRDEERMARDLYQLIADHYDGARPFANITLSEQRHFDATGRMLERYGLADPAEGKAAGSYADAEIQKLYDGWKERALTSRAEANKVGVELERRDIADLKKAAADESLPDDLATVYANLLAGSENHLRAFTAAVDGKSGLGNGQGQGHQRQGGQCAQGGQGNSQCQGSGECQGPGQGRGMQQRQGQCPGAQQGKQGQGPGQGMGPRRDGSGGGFGRTGERPADCPLAS